MMKKSLFLSLLCTLMLSLSLISCSDKKNHNQRSHTVEGDAPQPTQTLDPRTGDPVNPEPGHEYLNGKDITNNKKTCTMCDGSGKRNGAVCPECQGYGYILVYR